MSIHVSNTNDTNKQNGYKEMNPTAEEPAAASPTDNDDDDDVQLNKWIEANTKD